MMPWKIPFLSRESLKDNGPLRALLCLSLCRAHLTGRLLGGLGGGEGGVAGWGGRSLAEHESLEPLVWGGGMVMLDLVKNLGLLRFRKYAQNISECQGVYWRKYLEISHFNPKNCHEILGVQSKALGNQTRAKI